MTTTFLLLSCDAPISSSHISPLTLIEGTGQNPVLDSQSEGFIRVNDAGQAIDSEDGKCTLSEAVLSANQERSEGATKPGECATGQGNDTIIFDDISTVTLDTAYGIDSIYNLPTSLPPITTTITISGGIQGVVINRASGTLEPFRILQIEGPSGKLTLDNITLQGSNPLTKESSLKLHQVGGSIILYNQASLTLTNKSLITDTNGGGISASNGSRVTLFDSIIMNGTGRGVFVTNYSHVKLLHSSVRNMTQPSGGGLGAFQNSTIELINSNIGYNVSRSGGGIYADIQSSMMLTNSDIVSNTAKGGNGAGIAISSFGSPPLTTNITIKNSRIKYNRCQPAPQPGGIGPSRSGTGGGIHARFTKQVTITDSEISYNKCGRTSGIEIGSGHLTVKNSRIMHHTEGYGLITGAYAQILDNSYISNNRGGISNEGRIEIVDSYVLNNQPWGGIRSGYYGDLTVCNSSIMSNTAVSGGGVTIQGKFKLISVARFINSRISYNKTIRPSNIYIDTDGTGGGLYIEKGHVTIRNSELTHNSAFESIDHDGGGMGGAISANLLSRIQISHSNIAYNNATQQGGGIFVKLGSEITITDSQLVQNQALEGGAVQRLRTGKVTLSNSAIVDNSHTAITGTGWITATHNWWGQPDGPSGVGPGSGDSVASGVDFSDFRTQPIAIDEVEFPCIDEKKVFLPWVERRE